MRYRADIDGLRAVAVLPVVLFHGHVAYFTGGFIGVDVFFVISGFLITSLILAEIEDGRFSLFQFWERRARRILPALAFVVVASLIAGWLILLPGDFAGLGRSVAFLAFFSSNIHFWQTSGYFAAPATSIPLLHTWSLAVEEQYYLFYPSLFFLLMRYLRRWRNAVLLLGCAVSFAAAVWGLEVDSSGTFYLLPTRGWELLMGGFVACIAPLAAGRRIWNESLSVVGLVLIVVPIFLYDANTPFPAQGALPPCLGTALLIWANGGRLSAVGKGLTSRPLVFIGLLSYAIYLWHWPIFVYWGYAKSAELNGWEILIACAATGVLSYLSYRFVETPVRRRRVFATRRRVMAASGAGLAIVGLAGFAVQANQGLPMRFPPRALQMALAAGEQEAHSARCDSLKIGDRVLGHRCRFGDGAADQPIDFLFWGDSHAGSMLPIAQAMAQRLGLTGWVVDHPGCPPLLGVYRVDHRLSDSCRPFNDMVFGMIRSHRIRDVLLVSRWSTYTYGWEGAKAHLEAAPYIGDSEHRPTTQAEAQLVFEHGLTATIAAVRKTGARVWVLSEFPTQQKRIPQYLAVRARFGMAIPERLLRPAGAAEHEAAILATIRRLTDGTARSFDLASGICDAQGYCRIRNDAHALFADNNHPTKFGAQRIAEGLIEAYAKMRSSPSAAR